MRRFGWITLIATLGVASCAPGAEPAPAGCIQVDPRMVDLGQGRLTSEPAPIERQVTVSNACSPEGGLPLTLEGTELAGPEGPFSVTQPQASILEPGESTTITVLHQPMAPGTYGARLRILSDDRSTPVVEVGLTATVSVARLQVEPPDHGFDGLYIGCSGSDRFRIRNVGSAEAVIQDLVVTNTSEHEFNVRLDASFGEPPFTLAPYDPGSGGPEVELGFRYYPLDTLQDTATVTVYSDVPGQTEQDVQTSARGVLFGTGQDRFEVTGLETSGFQLTQETVWKTVAVQIDGHGVTAGWRYQPVENTVVFDPDAQPAAGSVVQVDYHLQPPCW